jgi:CMP-N-acetylneuraminic acid synthetase/GT2 family glycosyltransferase
MILASIIIRTKNEERWISSCLRSVYSQTYTNFEVILVDNNSTDRTVEKAKKFPIKLVTIEDFFPGKAINDGIQKSSGKYIVCLSGHCIPTSNDWLKNLVADLNLKDVAGVYGRQESLSFTSDIDKRDLLITFGLDKKIQIKDSFFHNANSAFRKDIWKKFPFDENATNIEDRLWGEKVVADGYKIIYEPNASVYHWHGIHQGSDPVRARNTVKILESMSSMSFNDIHTHPIDLNIVAVIPLRGETREICGEPLLEHTITSAKESKYIDKLVVSTDSSEVEIFARGLGVDVIFSRPEKLSEEYINVFDVLKYSVNGLEEQGMHFDIIVLLEEIYPFRDKHAIDSMIELLVYKGYDTVVAATREVRGLWSQSKSDNKLKLNDDALMPKSLKKSDLFISMPGLCCVTYPELIRDNSVFNHKVGLYEILNPISSISIRDKTSDRLASSIFQIWNNN